MARLKNFDEAREVLAGFVPAAGSLHKQYTLERMRTLMDKLGNPQDRYKVIHVAGTSGKTSTCYYIASLLQAAGQNVGMTVSPHIDEVNERVQINLKPLPETEFCRELSEFLDIVGKTGLKPTYFEVLVAFAFWEFARADVDYAVIEVGMGGLLDGTNVISRPDKVCVITDIGLDHTNVLGKTLAEIAAQKAGIIGNQNVVFSYPQPPEVRIVLQSALSRHDAHMQEIVISPKSSKLPNTVPRFQKRNWHLACAVYGYLVERDELPPLSGPRLLATVDTYIPARMELIAYGGKTLVLDGAHNQQKMQTLAASLREVFPNQAIATLLSIVKSEDFRARIDLAPIASLSSHLIITSFAGQQDFPKTSVDPATVAVHCKKLTKATVVVRKNPEQAFRQLLKRTEPILLITGSFYLMNHIRPLIFQNLRNSITVTKSDDRQN